MSCLSRSWMVLIAAGLVIASTACQKAPEQPPVHKVLTTSKNAEPVEQQEEPKPAAKAEPEAPAPKPRPKPKPEQSSPPTAIPKVVLSDALRANCIVGVGDSMPQAELSDIAGKMHALDSLYGEKLTVVFLWTSGTTHRNRHVDVPAHQLHDLMTETAAPFAEKGVRVVGINVGEAAAAVERAVSQSGATFPALLDPKGEYLAKIAKDKRLPRIFLLDASGKILWFDVEFRRQSREDLVRGIRVVIGKL